MIETERSMLDRLNVKYGKTYRNGSYIGRRYTRAEHVAEATGYLQSRIRIADYIAVDVNSCAAHDLTEAERAREYPESVYGRTGAIIGHEVKVSRSDWLSELADPTKAEAWRRYCNYWWLVAPRGIVRDDLPQGWGLMVPHGKSLRVVVPALRRMPEAMPTRTVAALTRAVMKTETRIALEATQMFHPTR